MEKRQRRVGAKALLFWQHETDGQQPKQLNKHEHMHKLVLLCTFGMVLTLLTTWLLGIAFHQKVQIGSRNVDAQSSSSSLTALLKEQTSNYKLTMQAKDGKKTSFSLDEIGIEIDQSATVSTFQKEAKRPASWLVWWQPKPIPIQTQVNEKVFQEFIQKHAKEEIDPVKNASLSISPEGKVELTKESTGKQLALANAEKTILRSITNLDANPLVLTEQTIEPGITEKSASASKSKLERILTQEAKFSLDTKTITAAPKDIGAWLTLTPDEASKDYKISADNTKILDYINKIASANFRRPRDQYEVVAKDGSKTIITHGINGLDVNNKEDAAKQISQKVLEAQGITLALNVSVTPFKVTSVQAGPKRIEVDTSSKRMYAYENDVLLKTFLISAGAPDTPWIA